MRALIFDLDRTLVGTVSAHVIGWERAFNELGLTIEAWPIAEAESLACRQGELFENVLSKRRSAQSATPNK